MARVGVVFPRNIGVSVPSPWLLPETGLVEQGTAAIFMQIRAYSGDPDAIEIISLIDEENHGVDAHPLVG